MRIGLYCRELRGTGGRLVGTSLLRSLASKAWPHHFTALVPEDEAYRSLSGGSVEVVPAPTSSGAWHLAAHRRLREELRELRPDVLYMMGNRALGGAPCPQAVLFQQSWMVYPESAAWRRGPLRQRLAMAARVPITNRSLRHAQAVSAQTPVMMERLHRLCGVPRERLVLMPNAGTPPLPEGFSAASRAAGRIAASGHAVKAVCVARHMPHKNLEVLLGVADALLALERTDIGIFVTVDPGLSKGARRFVEAIGRGGRSRVITNLGEVPMYEVPACYRAADALILPTLLESFSATYVDAMSLGLPVITSDLDFAHTVCGDAAMYVDPLVPACIAGALMSIASDTAGWDKRVAEGRQRARLVSTDWEAIADRTIDLLERVQAGASLEPLRDHPWLREELSR